MSDFNKLMDRLYGPVIPWQYYNISKQMREYTSINKSILYLIGKKELPKMQTPVANSDEKTKFDPMEYLKKILGIE